MSSCELHRYDESESCAGKFTSAMLYLPQHYSLGRRNVQPQHDRVSVDRHSCKSGVHRMPLERRVCGIAFHLRIMSSHKLQQHEESESRTSRLSEAVFDLPQHYGLGGGHVQSRYDGLSVDRCTCECGMHYMSLEWRVQGASFYLRILSSHELQRHDESEPYTGKFASAMLDLPHHHGLGGGDIQP
jgi:hypothetical protein